MSALTRSGVWQPAVAGVVGTLTGVFGSIAVLITGLTAAGATTAQAASGIVAVCVTIGVLSIALSWRTRVPYCFAWSTPAAALLAAAQGGRFAVAIGAFLLAGALVALTGALPALARLVDRIPPALSGALLAGVLWPFCIAPVAATVSAPLIAVPLIIGWLALSRFLPRIAGPAVILAALVVTAAQGQAGAALPPSIVFTAPSTDLLAVVALGVPIYLVTMAGQQLPGLAVLREHGFPARTRLLLGASGIGHVIAAPFGAVGVNMAAITGAVMVGPDAGERSRRWIAGVASGVTYLVVAAFAGVVAGIVGEDPPLLVQAAAGLALLGALVGAVTTAWRDAATRVPAAVTFLVVASGVAVAGIGSAFWGLLAGGVALVVLTVGRRPDTT